MTIEIPRDKGIVALRGLPDSVGAAKADLLALMVTKACKELHGKESALVIGKRGVAINSLVTKHQVAVDVSQTGEHDEFTAIVTGPSANVEGALQEMTELLTENQDVIEELVVRGMYRNMLLVDGGGPIRKLQKEVNQKVGGNVQLTFNREKASDEAVLQIKGRRASVVAAKQLVEETLDELKASLITVKADPSIVPIIIGRGGKNIDKIKDGKKSVTIEVDKVAGVITIHSADPDDAKHVEEAVKTIMAENQVKRIDFDPASIKTMFREITRSTETIKSINSLVWFTIDEGASQFILRGSQEKVSSHCLRVCLGSTGLL